MLYRTYRWESAFLQVVYEEDQVEIENMLKAGADVNQREYVNLTLYTPMHLAAMSGDLITMELLYRYGASINMENHTTTPLMYSVESDYPIAVRWLLDHGARINDVDEYNQTALLRAIDKKLEYCARLLIEAKADINIGNSALKRAKENGLNEIAKLLLENAEPQMEEKFHTNNAEPFEYEWNRIRCKRLPMWMERAYLQRNMVLEDNPLADQEWGETIKEAVINRDYITLRELCSRRKIGKAWLEQRLWQNKTPLCYAIENKDSELTRILLSLGAQIMEGYSKQDNPIAKAFESEDELIILEIMEALATNLALKQNMIPWNFGLGEWDFRWEGECFFLYQRDEREARLLQSADNGDNQVIKIKLFAGIGNTEGLEKAEGELEKYITSFRRALDPLGCYIWSSHYMYDNWLFSNLLDITKLTIYKCKDQLTAFENTCMNVVDLPNYLEVLRVWDRKYQLIFEDLEPEYCTLSFVKQPKDMEAFWKEVIHYFPKADDGYSNDFESTKERFMKLGLLELKLL